MKAEKKHRIIQKRTISNLSNSNRGTDCIQKVGCYKIDIEVSGSGHYRLKQHDGVVTNFGFSDERIEGKSYGKEYEKDLYKILYLQGPTGIFNSGIFDIGTNSIKKLSDTLYSYILRLLSNEQRPTIILRIIGHSRGAVALSLFFDKLKNLDSDLLARIVVLSSIQYDPVPGQTFSFHNKDINSSDVSPYYRHNINNSINLNSTVVYSLYTQYGREAILTSKSSFVPQAVFGTDVVILECQDHSVGLKTSEYYKQKDYLPPGVYLHNNKGYTKFNSYKEYKDSKEIDTYITKKALDGNSEKQGMLNFMFQRKRFEIIDSVVNFWFENRAKIS